MHRTSWKNGLKDGLLVLAATLFAAATPLALTGCNTTEGAGEDIEAAGDAIEDAAEDASN